MTTLVLKPGEEDRLLKGHPWIFEGELERVDGPAEPGDVVRLQASDGRELGFGHYNPRSRIAFRLLSREAPPDEAFFKARLAEALAKREALFRGEDAYRLCFGESDGLPGLVADRYGSVLVVQLLSAGMERAYPLIEKALVELLSPAGILLKNDADARKREGLALEVRTARGTVPDTIEIKESGLRFIVPLGGGQKTGFYFDQRANRLFMRDRCKGKRVLDLHCYVGAFALGAARSGAQVAMGLDSSARAIELARRNAALNGLEKRVRFEEGDAAAFLVELAGGPRSSWPDVILLDPPNFAHAKADLPAAERAYVRLFSKGLRCLKAGGLLAASTCSRHVTWPVLRRLLAQAAREAKRETETLAERGASEDHPVHPSMPETDYLHFALLRVTKETGAGPRPLSPGSARRGRGERRSRGR